MWRSKENLPKRGIAGVLLALLALGELAKSDHHVVGPRRRPGSGRRTHHAADGSGPRSVVLTSGYVVYGLTVALGIVFYRRGWREAAVAPALSTVGATMPGNVDELPVGKAPRRPPTSSTS